MNKFVCNLKEFMILGGGEKMIRKVFKKKQ